MVGFFFELDDPIGVDEEFDDEFDRGIEVVNGFEVG